MANIIHAGGYQYLDEMVQNASIEVIPNTWSADISAGERGILLFIITGPSSHMSAQPTATGTVTFNQVSLEELGASNSQAHQHSSVTTFDGGTSGGTITFSGGTEVWFRLMRKITQKQ